MLGLIGIIVVAASPFVARSLMHRGRREAPSNGAPPSPTRPRQPPSRDDKLRATAIVFWATVPATIFWIVLAVAHPDAIYTAIAVGCSVLFLALSAGWVVLRRSS